VKSFIGSTVAIVMGAISVIGQLTHASVGLNMDNVVGGITAVLGALAYQLAKRRKLGLKPDSRTRRALEFVLLAVVCIVPVAQTLMGVDFVTRPWSSLVIPAWSVGAYLWIRYRKPVPAVSFRG
jgi:hypothetical protein